MNFIFYGHKLATVRNTVYKLLSAMGVPRSEILSSKAWLTGLYTHNKLILDKCDLPKSDQSPHGSNQIQLMES